MAKIVTVAQMVEAEMVADAAGHTYADMMELAGRAIADAILERFEEMMGKHMLVLVGSGNNGGDGLVAAKWLLEGGATVAVYLTKERSEDDPHLLALKEAGVLIASAKQDQRSRVLKLQLGRADILLDAVLGTGFKLPLRGTAQEVLSAAKKALDGAYVVAVDCPSGLDCDSGEVSPESLSADLTVTLAAAKPGFFQYPGATHVGELVVADIGLEERLSSVPASVAAGEEVRVILPDRPQHAHKGTFGRALIAAGSVRYPGAAALAGRAAYLAGAGLVTIAAPAPAQASVAGSIPECTWLPMGERLSGMGAEDFTAEASAAQALLMGPGFGLAQETADFVEAVLEANEELPPLVADADALRLIGNLDAWPERLPQESVLTPHPGEMSALTDLPVTEIQSRRLALAAEYAERWDHIVVLKGAYSVIAHPDGRQTVIPVATAALARAGTGDVLAGLIVGYRAQGVPVFEAAILGSFIHARAGLQAGREVGTVASVLASDVASAIPRAIAALETLEA